MTELLSLTNDSEVLFRQVHPDLMDGEVPASSGFLPTPGDNDELSVDRSSITTAGAAFSLYTSGGRRSAAVFGVTVGEFRAEGIPCRKDPIPQSPTAPANPAHAIADYKQHGSNQQKKIAKRLKQKAVFRGKLHP
jgi:hypothetical protein